MNVSVSGVGTGLGATIEQEEDVDTRGWTTGDWKDFFIRWEEEQYHQQNLDAIDEYYSPDLVDHHLPAGYPPGNDGKRQLVRELLEAFPDFHITLEDLIVEEEPNGGGNRIVERFTISGTHRGEYRGIPATGNRFETHGMSICRFVDGKQVEHWAVVDELDMLQQLGVIDFPYRDDGRAPSRASALQ